MIQLETAVGAAMKNFENAKGKNGSVYDFFYTF